MATTATGPTEFRYWQRLDLPWVRRLRAVLGAVGVELAPPDEVVRELAAMYYDADPVAERFVDEVYLARGAVVGRAMLEAALAGAVPDDAPASLRALLADVVGAPPWLDREEVERGARAFRRYGTSVFRFGGAITVEGYAENSVAKPLVLTGAYAGDTARKRFLETAAFWIAVSEPGALATGGAGIAAALRVRIMHVFVRRKLAAHPEWDAAAWGVPISQGDALLTLMGGSFAPGLALHLLGFLPSRADILAMMHFWRYVGHLVGVRPRWYPTTLADAARLSFVTLIKGARGAGEDLVTLGQGYARAFAPGGDEGGWRAAWEDGIHRAYATLFTSPRTRREARLPAAGAWVLAPLAVAPLRAVAEIARRVVPGLEAVADGRARKARAAWLRRVSRGKAAEFKAAERFTR
jgi:hypothetical protein